MYNPYTKKQRKSILTPKQIVSALRIGKELLSTIQIIADDRIAEDENLRPLQSRGYEEELELARGIILKKFKTDVHNMSNL